jgi:hypothetical protein
MSKFFLRWIDSWSDSENAQMDASSEYVIEKKIQWLRIIPFILLYRLFGCILGRRVLVCCDLYARFFILYACLPLPLFFTVIFRIKLFKPHVLFNSC